MSLTHWYLNNCHRTKCHKPSTEVGFSYADEQLRGMSTLLVS